MSALGKWTTNMPSKTPKQAKFMRAIAHGWTPSRAKNPPSRAVAQEFVDADRKYSGGFAENRYWVGGLAPMSKVNAGFQGSLDNPFRKFEEGGDVVTDEALQKARAVADARLGNYKAARFTLGEDHSATQNLKESYLEAKHKAVDMANRVGAGAGGGGGAGYQRGGRARRRIGRVMPLNGGEQYTSTTYTPRPVVTARTSDTPTFGGVAGQPSSYAPPTAAVAPTTTYSGPRMAGTASRRGTGRRGRGGRRNGGGGGGGGGGAGGPGTTPRTIIPTDPASYVGGAAAGASGAVSPHVEQLRQHQAKIAATLGSARGGHVNYYEEGGAVRPGHAEGPNPFEGKGKPAQYNLWESENHIDPPPPPAVAEEVEEEGGVANWLRSLFTPDPGTAIGSGEARGTIEEQMEGMEQAYGGYVGYQAGGLATAAPGRILPPVGGVPPWIEPVGSGPGFSEPEPEGYQFGGMAARMGPAMNMAGRLRGGQRGGGGQYRGVPPQRGGIQRGAPPGGGRGFRGMMNQARQQYGAGQNVPGFSRYLNMQREAGGPSTRMNIPPGGTPQGALAQMYGQAQQQRAQAPGFAGLVGGAQQPGGGLLSRFRRAQEAGQQPGGPGGIMDRIGGGGGDFGAEMRRARGMQTYQDVVNRGGGGINPMMESGQRMYGGRPTPGLHDPQDMLMGEGPGGRLEQEALRRQAKMQGPGRFPGAGKPRPGPGMMPPGGGGIIGGPRVPPNMQGYLQKQRMMNRPPANVGGGANRVGMADQQGAFARATQRGTGRAPPSRRFGRGRAGRGRGFETQ